MKIIKVIDLLNMISKGEEVPKKIKYLYYEYEFNEEEKEYQRLQNEIIYGLGEDRRLDIVLDDEVEIIEENKKELHANNIEFNIYDDKKEFIITLDENDLGIDKLHLDNCYFYKENDKWYVKHINLKPIAYISQEHKIPEKIDIKQEKNIKNNWKWKVYGKEHSYNISTPQKIIADKINEIIDYLEEKE
jgi:hypothetical protein